MKIHAELSLNKVHIGTDADKKPCIKSVTLDIIQAPKEKKILTPLALTLDGSMFPDFMDPEEKLSGIYSVGLEITIKRNIPLEKPKKKKE